MSPPPDDHEPSQVDLRRLRRQVARRRREVERLRAQVAILSEEAMTGLERTVRDSPTPETARGRASYSLAARLHRRGHTRANAEVGLREPVLDLAPKLPARRWAELNGVATARVLGRWSDPDTVAWDSLPDRFVLKSNVGAGAVNVFPLQRRDGTDDFVDLLTGETTTREDVTARLWARHGEESWYFAEELLVGRSGEPGTVPADVKVFCFYGEPFYVEVRRGDQSRAAKVTQRVRAFTIDGTELVDVRALMDPGDGEVTRPEDFAAIATACRTLSGAIRRPLERLDVFETDAGVRFCEVTLSPGRPPALVPEWDQRMGEVYEDAYARLLRDLAAEGALQVTYGRPEGQTTPDDDTAGDG